MTARRRFGSIRKLPSGRWHASFITDEGERQSAPATFPTKKDADRWLARVDLNLDGGQRRSAADADMAFGEYAATWLQQNPHIGPRWRETCERNLRLHLKPLHDLPLSTLSSAVVRHWYSEAIRLGGGRTSVAQSYRFMRAVLNTAVRDEAIMRNPCQLPGAGTPKAPRRPVATPRQIAALTEVIAPPYRAAVVLAAWGGLRRGEILALSRDDLNLEGGHVTVRRSQTELLTTGKRFDSTPKTDAGYRTVALPPHILPTLRTHLEQHAGTTRLFVAADGEPMRGNTLYQAFTRARHATGMDGFRFHDLRHTGQTLAAATGATLADLMKRLGHSSPTAALRYLHTINGRDQAIANALSVIAEHGDAAALPPPQRSR